MPVGFAIAGIASLGAAALGADAAKDAAKNQQAGAGEASRVQREMFNTVLRQQQPFVQSGYGANAELSRLLGIGMPSGGGGTGPGGGVPVIGGWEANGGQLVGDTWLPPGASTVDKGKGWYEVNYGGQRVGTLRPGGKNGRFINDTNWAMPTPQQGFPGGAPSGSAGGGEVWRPTASGGVTRGIGMGPGGGGEPTMSNDMMPEGTGGTGLPTGYLTQLFGPQQFLAGMDPGYQFRLQQGAQGVLNGASAASGSLSGPALKALLEYNQGAASGEFGAAFDRFQTQQGNIFQRLSDLANRGQNAAANVGNQGIATAGNIGSNIIGAANAGAAGTIGAANAYGGALSDLGGLAYLYANRPKPPPKSVG